MEISKLKGTIFRPFLGHFAGVFWHYFFFWQKEQEDKMDSFLWGAFRNCRGSDAI